MLEREGFPIKPKHQYHLHHRVEWVYGAQSWKENRLLYESVFVQIGKWTLKLKNDGKRSIFYETKASMSFIPMSETSF